MKTILKKNYKNIIERLIADDEFIDALKSRGCFKNELLESIKNETDLRSRNARLLNTLMRGSTDSLIRFVWCLNDNRQDEVARLLTGGKRIL